MARVRSIFIAAVAVATVITGARAVADEDPKLHLLKDRQCPGCNLEAVDLREAKLDDGDPKKPRVMLNRANLKNAAMSGAQLRGALLQDANLSGSHLQGTDLRDAVMINADLSGALMKGTKLDGAKMCRSNLTGVVFEPDTLPDVQSLSQAVGLKTITWETAPNMLIALRKKFKENGMDGEERQITYAIKRHERMQAGMFERVTGYVLLELTTDWGLAPWRPLLILLGLVPLFAAIYAVAIVRPPLDGGIWWVWDKERVDKTRGTDSPTKLTLKNCNVVPSAIYFSLLSAFFVGWREVDVGTWISRLSPREQTLRATGWVRTVSGVQSLLSVFLLALWLLCYFGRPF
jgi:hypothetical protein